jgi:hypothetical protein
MHTYGCVRVHACVLLTAGSAMMEVRAARKAMGVVPAFKRVDTCAAEFEADTPYMYSTYDGNCECAPTTARKVRQSAVGTCQGARPAPAYEPLWAVCGMEYGQPLLSQRMHKMQVSRFASFRRRPRALLQ